MIRTQIFFRLLDVTGRSISRVGYGKSPWVHTLQHALELGVFSELPIPLSMTTRLHVRSGLPQSSCRW